MKSFSVVAVRGKDTVDEKYYTEIKTRDLAIRTASVMLYGLSESFYSREVRLDITHENGLLIRTWKPVKACIYEASILGTLPSDEARLARLKEWVDLEFEQVEEELKVHLATNLEPV